MKREQWEQQIRWGITAFLVIAASVLVAMITRSVLRTALSWICTKKPTGMSPVGPNHKIFGVTPERRTTRLTPSSLARWETSRMPL